MRYTTLLFILLVISACTNSTQESKSNIKEDAIDYPAELVEIFDNHGGLDKW